MMLQRPSKDPTRARCRGKSRLGPFWAPWVICKNGGKLPTLGLIRTEFYIPSTVSKLNDPEQATKSPRLRTAPVKSGLRCR